MEAVDKVLKLPHETKNTGELLSAQHAEQKLDVRKMLNSILSSIRFMPDRDLFYMTVEAVTHCT